MNLGRNVRCRQAGNVRDLLRRIALEVQQHDLAIYRLQLVDQRKQLRCGDGRVCLSGVVDRGDFGFQVLQCDKAFGRAPPSNDMRRPDVIRYASHPRPEGTAMIEQRHASPQFDMHLLKEVGPEIGIGLVAPGEPSKQCPMEPARFLVQIVLLAAIQGLLGAPIGNSRAIRKFSYRSGANSGGRSRLIALPLA
jgi:hypothetical protein